MLLADNNICAEAEYLDKVYCKHLICSNYSDIQIMSLIVYEDFYVDLFWFL